VNNKLNKEFVLHSEGSANDVHGAGASGRHCLLEVDVADTRCFYEGEACAHLLNELVRCLG
jgi:hypothetical protein